MRPHLASLVDDFRAHADETAVVAHRGVRRYRTTYGELAQLAGRFAAELARRGVGPGERVVLWGANSAEWIAVFFGCVMRGVLAVPLDAAGSAEFAERVIADTGPRLIVGDAKLLALLGVQRSESPATLPLRDVAQSLPAEPLFTVDAAVTPEAPFQIVFTSGTTAEPRGIVHTHRNVLVTLEPIEREIAKYRRYERIFHPLRFLHLLPLSHVFGQFLGLWIPAVLGAELHFSEQPDPARVVETLKRERISVLIAVPRVLQLLRGHLLTRFPGLAADVAAPAAAPGSAVAKIAKKWWRFRRVHRALGWKFWAIISGGATLPLELEGFFHHIGVALVQGYGMTETSALVTLNHPFHVAPGTIGKELPGREVRIGEDGEILVRGAMVSGATWQGGAMRAREGEWLATGDLAERSETGELRFLGRKGDVIVTGAGLNIHPADLESALAAQAGIRAAAVVACEFTAGPEPVAVVLTALGDAELDAAVSAANRTLAEFQRMRRVLRWPEPQLPYTSTGKLLRRAIAEWACAELAGRGAQAERGAPRRDALLALIGELTGETAPAAQDIDALRLTEDLHLDSLGRVQLQSAMEQRFAIEVNDDSIGAAETLGDLRRVIGGETALSVVRSPNYDSSPEPRASGDPTPPMSRQMPLHERGTRTNPPEQSLGGAPATFDENIYPQWPWSWPLQAARAAFLECAMRALVWLLAKPRVVYEAGVREALERLVHNNEPVLIIANHITAYDGPLVLYGLPGALRRHVAAAMSGEMLLDFRRARNQGNWLLNLLAPAAYGLLTGLFNVFPLPRGRGFRRSFAHAGEAMGRGYSVLVFPEGTRSRAGKMNPFRSGIGLLAQQTEATVVPVALAGVYELVHERGDPARRQRWFHAGSIEVRVGAPILTQVAAEPTAVAAELERRLRELLAETVSQG